MAAPGFLKTQCEPRLVLRVRSLSARRPREEHEHNRHTSLHAKGAYSIRQAHSQRCGGGNIARDQRGSGRRVHRRMQPRSFLSHTHGGRRQRGQLQSRRQYASQASRAWAASDARVRAQITAINRKIARIPAPHASNCQNDTAVPWLLNYQARVTFVLDDTAIRLG
jgi:hypothetical protein